MASSGWDAPRPAIEPRAGGGGHSRRLLLKVGPAPPHGFWLVPCARHQKSCPSRAASTRRPFNVTSAVALNRIHEMPRIPRVSGLKALPLNLAPSSASPARPSFAAARAISTTCVARGKNTEWVRGKLWKGEAPGPEDPYTQRPEPEESSNLPEEALEYQPHPDRTPAQILASRLTLPPKRTEATPESQLKSSDPTYVPATDAEGLEEISTITTWWDQPGHWGGALIELLPGAAHADRYCYRSDGSRGGGSRCVEESVRYVHCAIVSRRCACCNTFALRRPEFPGQHLGRARRLEPLALCVSHPGGITSTQPPHALEV